MWEGWEPAPCMPDRCFCEAVGGGLIRQPSNAWSNLGFCVAGVLMLVSSTRSAAAGSPRRAACFGIAVFLIGASGFYHACSPSSGSGSTCVDVPAGAPRARGQPRRAAALAQRAMLVLAANLRSGCCCCWCLRCGGSPSAVLLAILASESGFAARAARLAKGAALSRPQSGARVRDLGLDIGKSSAPTSCSRPRGLAPARRRRQLLLWRYYRGPRITA